MGSIPGLAGRGACVLEQDHNCFVLRMGCKSVGPVCCVMHVKETRTLIVKEKGLAPVFLDSRLEHPAGWICARYKSSVLLLLESLGEEVDLNYTMHCIANYMYIMLAGASAQMGKLVDEDVSSTNQITHIILKCLFLI